MRTIVLTVILILFAVNTNSQILTTNRYKTATLNNWYQTKTYSKSDNKIRNKLIVAASVNLAYFIATDIYVYNGNRKDLVKPAGYGFLAVGVISVGYVFTFNGPKKYKR